MQYKMPFSMEVAEISKELGVPKATVERVLRLRTDKQIKRILNGESITVEGLFSIRTLKTGDSITVRCSVSPTLRKLVQTKGKPPKLRMSYDDPEPTEG